MKTFIYPIILLTTILIGCKKDKNEPAVESPSTISGGSINTTPAYVPPQPGTLNLNIHSLVLHPGDNATVSATLYNDTGGVVFGSSFLWQSQNNNIATVSGGLITANNIGSTYVMVTDGTHGFSYVNVSVVSTSSVISNAPTQIVYGIWPGFMGLRHNMTRTIGYTLYDASGNVVTGVTPTFVAPTNSGLLISGNSITAPNFDGFWDVSAIIGGDTLSNKLKTMVFNSSDTITRIHAEPNCPYFFPYYNVSAAALNVEIVKTWWNPITGFAMKIFTTSPTKILIDLPSVAILNSAGLITSVGPGNTKVTIQYQDAIDVGYIFVDYDFTGNWGGIASNGDSYNFCFDRENPDVFYRYNIASFETGFWEGGYLLGLYNSGSYKIIKGGTLVSVSPYNASIYTFPGFDYPNTSMSMTHSVDNWFCQFYTSGVTGGTFLWQTDKNKMKFIDGSNTIVLQRGAGNCGPSFEQILKGTSGTSWLPTSGNFNAPSNAINPGNYPITYYPNNTVDLIGWNSDGTFGTYINAPWQIVNDNGTTCTLILNGTSSSNVSSYSTNSFVIGSCTYLKQP